VFIAEIEGHELAGFIDKLRDNNDPRSTLEWFVREYGAYVALPENALLGVEILTEATRNPAVADVFGRNRDRLIAALSDCIASGVKSGVFAPQVDTSVVARMILDTLEGQGLHALSQSPAERPASHAICAFVLNGLKP
jgi:hypothetical protein